MYVMYTVQRYENELLTRGCKWTGMNLKVMKSHNGQYIAPFTNVGTKSRFNLAMISPPFSPENET